jgi:hypothetical protein
MVASQALAAQQIQAPSGTDNLEFEFHVGQCTDRINLKVFGNESVFVTTTYGCSQGLKTFRWQTDGAFGGFDLFGVFEEGAPETLGRRTILIKDAYWTSGPAFAEPLWRDGRRHVVVVPEPATWTLLLSGFALSGMALRGRRRRPDRSGA